MIKTKAIKDHLGSIVYYESSINIKGVGPFFEIGSSQEDAQSNLIKNLKRYVKKAESVNKFLNVLKDEGIINYD